MMVRLHNLSRFIAVLTLLIASQLHMSSATQVKYPLNVEPHFNLTSVSGRYMKTMPNENNSEVSMKAIKSLKNSSRSSLFTSETYWAIVYSGMYASYIQETSDGGFILSGTVEGPTTSDAVILKLNNDGTIAWQKVYGSPGYEWIQPPASVKETRDGGFIVAGGTSAFGAGYQDVWLLKLTMDGSISWQKTYGDVFTEHAFSIHETSDGGFIVGGIYASNAMWLFKLNGDGTVVWQRRYGGSLYDEAHFVRETSDGGFIVGGYTNTYGNRPWILKFNSIGDITWQKTYDNSGVWSILEDNGFIGAGCIYSPTTNMDLTLMKLDSNGNFIWGKKYGGTDDECGYAIDKTTDGGFIVGGYTTSFGAGFSDLWLIKTNSSGVLEWEKTYGGLYDEGYPYWTSVQETSDGGFILSGDTNTYGGALVLKLNSRGEIPGCNLGRESNAQFGDIVSSVADSSAVAQSTFVAPANSFVVPQDSMIQPILLCRTPILDLPFDYTTRGSNSGFAGVFFRSAFLARTKSIFDHDLPDNTANKTMLPYLGYAAVSFPKSRFPCGPPNYKCYDGHDGYDFSQVRAGEPVLAAAAGIIDEANTGWGCLGWHVTIDHGNGFKTVYGHLRDRPTVTGTVESGDIIGVVGNTFQAPCFSTSAHIHFEVLYNDVVLDPSGWLGSADDPWAIDPTGRKSFRLWRHLVPWQELWPVEGQVGGSYTSSSGATTIDVPPGALSGIWDFTLTDVPVAEPSATLKPTGHSFALDASQAQPLGSTLGTIAEITLNLETTRANTLTLPLMITIHYTDTEITGLDESTLSLYWWDEQGSIWMPLTTTLDIVSNTAIANAEVFGLFALLIDDNDLEGPSIGQPVFSPTVISNQWLTVTVYISDTLTGNHGVSEATLYYSYTVPYTQTTVAGVWPGGMGEGTWTFAIPSQGKEREGYTLKFSIEAVDGDLSSASSINDDYGAYFEVMILAPDDEYFVYLPVIHRSP